MVDIKKRESNFELLRVVSMLMIITWHLLLQGGFFDNSHGITRIVFIALEAIIVVHVNSFVLVTGYFQSKSSFKLKKILRVIFLVWFYKIFALSLMLVLNKYNGNSVDLFKNVSPINYQDYWFISIYVLLYFISPLLNIIIREIDKNKLRIVLVLLFFIFSFLPSFTMQEAYNNNQGYSLGNFILLYFIGAYIRKYYSSREKILKNCTLRTKKYVLLFIFIGLALYNSLMYIFANYVMVSNSNILNYFSSIIKKASFSYDNPIVIFQSVIYLLLFSMISIKSRIINTVSKTTFGIYLIHTNKLFRPYVYENFGINGLSINNMISSLLMNSLLLFIICMILELLRIGLSSIIKNHEVYKKMETKLVNYANLVDMKIPW